MRFIHIADVHLGMQPDAGFPWSEERGEAIWESFRRIIRLAGREKTDFLLIAGDLFQCQPLLRELKEVNDLFASIPETIVVLIAGNHDYVKRESFYRGFDWADNVVMLLSPEPECVEVPEKKTAVYGCSYDKKEILENRLDGVRTTKNILKQKSLIGFVPDFFGVYENLNVIEYLEFFAASYGIYGRAGTVRAREVLEMVELSGKEEQMVDSLSRGIQQRLCLARAMIHKPKLLVLDEPNSGLDPRSRKDFQLLLQRLAREDYTILISSHILSELADLCTSIGVINGGVMVQQGKLENIMLAIDSSNPLRITVLNQVPKALELLRQDPQVSRLSVDENKIAAWFSGSREEEAYLLQKLVDAGILVVSFAREHNSLESLFFHLTGETEQKSRNTETFGNTIG